LKIVKSVLFNLALEYATGKVQENQVGLKLHLLAYADDVNLRGDNIGNINKNTGTLNNASKEIGLEINAEQTKHISSFACDSVWL
jgi:hypothetical protein